jgi:hypothetical protein
MQNLAQSIIKNTKGLKIQTPTGMKSFSGMSKTWHEEVVEIISTSNKIICGLHHKFLVECGWCDAEHIEPGMSLTTIDGGDDPILSVKILKEPQFLYDLLDVEGGSAYMTTGVISHNCQFISSEAMLLDSLKLSYLKAAQPIREDMGFKFWKEDFGGRDKTYLVGIDPATGTGNDFTVIQVVEFPSLEQVIELRLNQVNVPLIYAKIKWLFKFLRKPGKMGGRSEILWTFERNGVGEALVALIQNDESPDGGVYIDGVDLYSEKDNRLGVYTTNKVKMLTCMQLKNLLEKGSKDGLHIRSETLLFELQNFISVGNTYKAKTGCTDDAVMAMTLIMKLLTRLSSYDEKARKIVYESVAPDADAHNDDEEGKDQFEGEALPFVI